MAELKPCPFCGNEARIAVKQDSGRRRVWYVRCSKCNARTDGCYEPIDLDEWAKPHEKIAETIDRAVKLWNRRANDGSTDVA